MNVAISGTRAIDLPRASIAQLMTRALRLRCPHCGGKCLFASFFQL
jgi:uncharacterized protein (DUF983 family)